MAKAKQSLRKKIRRGSRAKAAKASKAPPGLFPIVGVGASAGGLEAFEQLLKRLPADTGMAFVLVQHLDLKHESQLAEILSRATSMPVAEVKDGMPVEPNHVYIIAPNTNRLLQDGVLRLELRKDSKTMRQQAEEEVRGGEERFRLIADSLPGPLSYVDMNQCYRFSNKAYEEWFGVPREQLKGRPVRDILGPAAYETVKPYIEKALEGQRTSFEGYIPYEAGRRFVHIDYVPTSDDPGQVDGFYVLLHDLTQLKIVEEQFRAFVESAPDAMIVVGAKGEIILANQQAEQLFGYTREELLGRKHETLVPAAVREQHVALRTEYLKNPTARPMGTGLELYGVRKDGRQFPVEISLSPIRAGDSVVISSIIRDVTDRKRLEQVSRQEAILKERNRLARDVHDNLAQGLTSIVLQLEACEEVLTREPQEAQKHIERARSVARSSLEEARRSLVAMQAPILHETSLPDAIEQIISDLRQESSARIELSVHGTPRPLSLEMQEHLLRVSQEALRNAIRHAKAKEVRVELTYDPDAVGMLVEDNGIGFSARKVRGGLGLGLTIMRERASELGAQFNLRSQPGKGTCVEVRMPFPAGAPGRPAQ
jgi:PAS domain S-box-containing protein